MPKMKTHRGSAKRFKKTGSGKLKRSHAYTSHLFANKSQKQKRKLRKGAIVHNSTLAKLTLLLLGFIGE